MARLGTLDVALRARTEKFTAGMKKARAQLVGFAKIAAGFAGLQAFRGVLADADQLGKMSDRLNIATEDLQAFQHAADLTGAGSALMNRSLDVMNKRLGEAAAGFGSALPGLRLLNLEAKDFAGLNTAQRFELIADRIASLSDETTKAAATSAIFSRAGLQLVNTLDLGAQGLRDVRKELETGGGLINREQVRAIEEFNDQITTLKANLRPLGVQIARSFTLVTTGVSMVKNLLVEGVGGVQDQVKRLGAGVLKAAADMVDGLLKLIERYNRAVMSFGPSLPRIPGTEGLRFRIEETRKLAADLRKQVELGKSTTTGSGTDKADPFKDLLSGIENVDTRAQTFGANFANILDGLINKTTTLAGALRSVANSFLRSGLERIGMNLGNAIFGGGGGASQGLDNPNVIKNISAAQNAAVSAAFGSYPGSFS